MMGFLGRPIGFGEVGFRRTWQQTSFGQDFACPDGDGSQVEKEWAEEVKWKWVMWGSGPKKNHEKYVVWTGVVEYVVRQMERKNAQNAWVN